MGLWGDVVVGVLLFVALIGVVVQVLPGALLAGGAVIVWGIVQGGAVGWSVAGAALVLTATGQVVKLLLAGRYLTRSGVPNSTMVWGGVAG